DMAESLEQGSGIFALWVQWREGGAGAGLKAKAKAKGTAPLERGQRAGGTLQGKQRGKKTRYSRLGEHSPRLRLPRPQRHTQNARHQPISGRECSRCFTSEPIVATAPFS